MINIKMDDECSLVSVQCKGTPAEIIGELCTIVELVIADVNIVPSDAKILATIGVFADAIINGFEKKKRKEDDD